MKIGLRELLILNVIIIIGLFFTSTNLIPISVLPFIFFLILSPFLFLVGKRISKITFWTFTLFIVSFISLFFYSPQSFFNPSFYRWDGNFFVSYLPLLFLPLLPEKKFNIKKIVFYFLVFGIFSNLTFSLYQFFSGSSPTGLFFATNAFGGFMMIVLSFTFSNYFYSNKNSLNFILLALSLLLLIFSYSRGSILAIFAAIICVIFNRKGNYWITRLSFLFIIAVQGIILFYTYPIYESSPMDAFAFAISDESGEKVSNVFIRIYENWPRGLYMFFQSPIVGTGLGSANDLPHIFTSNEIIQFNQNTIRFYNSAHAHHTFLNVLGELGIIGLILLIMVLKSIYTEITDHRYDMSISIGLEIAFLALIFASFTEHRLFSPSNIFPFILIFLLNYKNYYKNLNAQ